MKKLIIACGIIGGLISGCWGTFGSHVLPHSVSITTLTWLGYTSMILSFSLIFVAIKKYRENFGDGRVSFGKALGIGLLITLIASTLYVAVWLIGYYLVYPDFFEKYMIATKAQMQAEGKSAAAISQALAGIAKYRDMYNNPIFNIMLTYREILPVGVVISAIAALILKNKQKPVPANG
jgi:hypothetical protein